MYVNVAIYQIIIIIRINHNGLKKNNVIHAIRHVRSHLCIREIVRSMEECTWWTPSWLGIRATLRGSCA